MDKIAKFLGALKKSERALFLRIFRDIEVLKLEGYDVKPLTGAKGIYRLRKGRVRVLFGKSAGKGFVVKIGYRKDIYQ